MSVRNPHAAARLAKSMIERTARGVTPLSAITAPLPELDPYDVDKGLLEQRERYIAQSAATVAGRVAPFPGSLSPASPPLSPRVAGCRSSSEELSA